MKLSGFALYAMLLVALLATPLFAAPIVLGLANKHPLSESQVGGLLLGELRCVACHSRKDAPQPLERAAPDLSDVGSRVAPDFLRRFIASPSASHSGTTMPDLLSAESPDQRAKIAEAITHFLIAQSPRKFQRQAIDEHDVSIGKALFHTVGCIACHSPRDDNRKEATHEGVVELGHIPAKYSLASLAEFLFQPARVRPSGRMPDMKLTRVEAKAIASYLLGTADTTAAPLQPRRQSCRARQEVFSTIQLCRLPQTRRYSRRGNSRSFRRREFNARLPFQNAGQKSAIQSERRPNQSDSRGAGEAGRTDYRQGTGRHDADGVQLHRLPRSRRFRRRFGGAQPSFPDERKEPRRRRAHSAAADARRSQVATGLDEESALRR